MATTEPADGEPEEGLVRVLPELAPLAARMAEEHGAYTQREYSDGSFELTATKRSATLLREWLDTEAKFRPKSGHRSTAKKALRDQPDDPPTGVRPLAPPMGSGKRDDGKSS